MSKDIVIQNIPLQTEANYKASSQMPSDEIGEYPKQYIQYNVTNDSNTRSSNDRYPLEVQESIRESNTATAVYRTRAGFVAGSGASNEDMGEFVVNPDDGTTVNQIIAQLAPDAVKQKQNYIFVKLNDLRTDAYSISRIASQNARLGKPNKQNKVSNVKYSAYAFGTYDWFSQGGKSFKSYPFYSEEKTSANQIYYYNYDREYNEYYPYPLSKTQFELFRTDAQITRFHYNNLKNNFFGGAMISLVGNPNREVKIGEDSDNEPIYDTWGNVMANELGRSKAGAENAGNMTIIWANPDSPENTQAPVIQPITANTQADIFSSTQADVTDNIARFAEVPTLLANIQVSGKLGNSDEFVNSVDALNISTEKERSELEHILNRLLQRFPEFRTKFKDEKLVIQPLTLATKIPDNIWAEMDRESRLNHIRKYYSIEISEDDIEEVSNETNEKEEQVQKDLEQEATAIVKKYKKDE